MLDDDPLEQLRADAGVPDAFGVDDDDRAAGADAKTGGLATLHTVGAEEEVFALQESRQ